MMSSDSDTRKIGLAKQTKQRLERLQRDGETFDETVERLLDIHGPAVAPEWAAPGDSDTEVSD